MNYLLAYQLFKGNWCIDERFVKANLPWITNLMSGQSLLDGEKKKVFAKILAGEDQFDFDSDEDVMEDNSVMIIDLQGTLFKNNAYCAVSMQQVENLIHQANANKKIIGIVLNIDSPGGTVDGTMSLGQVIKDSSKPIVAYTDGLIASAAYWVASQSQYIIANNIQAEIGSIGVMMSMIDYEPYDTARGIKYHTIYASQSSDKNQYMEQVQKGKYDEYRENVLDKCATDFINKVIAARPQVKKRALTGKVFFAEDAIEMGLIDSIGSFEEAVLKVIELAENKDTKQNKDKSMSKKFKKLEHLLGFPKMSIKNGCITLSEKQLQDIEDALSDEEDIEDVPQETEDPTPVETPSDSIANQQQFESLKKTIKALELKLKKLEDSAEEDGNTPSGSADFGEKDDGFGN